MMKGDVALRDTFFLGDAKDAGVVRPCALMPLDGVRPCSQTRCAHLNELVYLPPDGFELMQVNNFRAEASARPAAALLLDKENQRIYRAPNNAAKNPRRTLGSGAGCGACGACTWGATWMG